MRLRGMKPFHEIDHVGWGFFGVVFLVLVSPITFLTWYYTLDNVEWPVRVLTGVFFSSVCAAVVAFVVNDLLFRRARRRYEAAQKAEKNMQTGGGGKKQKKKH